MSAIAAQTSSLDPMTPQLYTVQRRRRETSDTFTLEMAPHESGAGISFAPGQFNMLYIYGVGEVPISISSDPTDPYMVAHTTREVGTVTRAMGSLKPGDALGVRGPYGTAWPVDAARGRDVVLVAGGIGLAPLRPALYRLIALREHFGKVVLLYGTRDPADILFRRELERWRASFDLQVYVTVDRAAGNWRGHVGVVTTLIPHAPFDPSNAVAMVCGPEVMMRYTVMELERRGVGKDRIHISMERNMKCAVGFCGHCQFGPTFICKDGPVFRYDRVEKILGKPEI